MPNNEIALKLAEKMGIRINYNTNAKHTIVDKNGTKIEADITSVYGNYEKSNITIEIQNDSYVTRNMDIILTNDRCVHDELKPDTIYSYSFKENIMNIEFDEICVA